MRTAVFIGLAFAVGILAEDISFKYVDSMIGEVQVRWNLEICPDL
jgi:hypothetical protein